MLTNAALSVNGNPGFLGQIPATATNDNAASGNVGEFASITPTLNTATVTITNASPCVVTWTGHPYAINSSGIVSCGVIHFTNAGGALNTGLSVSTNYYAVPIDANTLHIASSVANALAGTFLNTSSAGTGTQTGKAQVIFGTGVASDFGGVALPAGDWMANGMGVIVPASTVTVAQCWINTASATAPSGANLVGYSVLQAALTSASFQIMPVGPVRLSLSALTNVFLSGNYTFASTAVGYAVAQFHRMR